ncbi:hypothetical protein [Sphingomonas solaris]|uniref:Uncharacterized protein n=1 Tax=Alterirhizorhabdus solaris TaxID=2529389 RepID=A0A558R818_9SPHN|nr:hypothetical protein [Sphingomonas solaris]TVV75539.1 hypothetical protein FOY91_06665 [Sphingomonas solaris]
MSIVGQLAASFGAPGLLVGFMIWAKQVDRADRRTEVGDRLDHDKARLEADKSMASSLAALTAVIQQLGR